MKTEAEAVAEVETECSHFALTTNVGSFRQLLCSFVGTEARLQHLNRVIHPLACAFVGVTLRRGRTADGERAVVAGAVTNKRVDDIEVSLIARTDQPIGEVVRMRAAAFS